jgi:hypothetical protein
MTFKATFEAADGGTEVTIALLAYTVGYTT